MQRKKLFLMGFSLEADTKVLEIFCYNNSSIFWLFLSLSVCLCSLHFLFCFETVSLYTQGQPSPVILVARPPSAGTVNVCHHISLTYSSLQWTHKYNKHEFLFCRVNFLTHNIIFLPLAKGSSSSNLFFTNSFLLLWVRCFKAVARDTIMFSVYRM